MRPIPLPPAMLIVASLAAVLGACGDAVTDPDALLDSAEAEAVLRSAEALPALPTLIDAASRDPATGERSALLRARELWTSGATLDDAVGRARRRLAVRYAAPTLARALTTEEWAGVRSGLEDWMVTAESSLRHLALPKVDARVRAADRYLDRAGAASTTEAAAADLLYAAAELVETTPRFVARQLTAEAEVAVSRAETAAGEERGASLERARRLKDWAARAVEEGAYLLAIQRAYYALQLVEDR